MMNISVILKIPLPCLFAKEIVALIRLHWNACHVMWRFQTRDPQVEVRFDRQLSFQFVCVLQRHQAGDEHGSKENAGRSW